MRERNSEDEDTVSEDWLEVPLEQIPSEIWEGRQIMAAKMIDRVDNTFVPNDVKRKYLIIVFEGGIVASLLVRTPLHSDDYIHTLMLMDDDVLFEGIITIVFLLIFIVSVILKRRRARNYAA